MLVDIAVRSRFAREPAAPMFNRFSFQPKINLIFRRHRQSASSARFVRIGDFCFSAFCLFWRIRSHRCPSVVKILGAANR